jgi:hypothetical protein
LAKIIRLLLLAFWLRLDQLDTLPPGPYCLVAGVYLGPLADKRVPVRSTAAPPVQGLAMVGWIKVPQPAVPPHADMLALDATLGDLFALRGASASLAGEVRSV